MAVLDASALLALLHGEPGQEVVQASLEDGAAISTVNYAEAMTRIVKKGASPQAFTSPLLAYGLVLHPFLEEDALQAALLVKETAKAGLSLGDRACLALAKRLDLPVLTADRVWKNLRTGVKVQLIR